MKSWFSQIRFDSFGLRPILQFSLWLGAVSLLACSSSDASDEGIDAKPSIEVYPQVFNLGKVSAWKPLELIAVLTNPTSIPVKVAAVKASCGCTTSNLAVGTEVTDAPLPFPISIAMEGKTGYNNLYVSILWDSDIPETIIEINFEVDESIILSHETINLEGTAFKPSAGKTELIIDYPTAIESLQILGIQLPMYSIMENPFELIENRLKVEIGTSQVAPLGRFSGSLIVRSNHRTFDEIRIPISITRRSSLRPEISPIFLDRTGLDVVSPKVNIFRVDGQPYTVKEIITEEKEDSYKIDNNEAKESHSISFDYPSLLEGLRPGINQRRYVIQGEEPDERAVVLLIIR